MTTDPTLVDAALAEIPEIELSVAALSAAHLLARVMPPTRTDSSWQVDLSQPRFTVLWGGAEVSSGPCRLLGTWNAETGLLWGWANASVSLSGTQDVRAAALSGPLGRLAAARRVPLSEEQAIALLGWLAWRHGWQPFAAVPGDDGGARVLLGVRLDQHHALDDDSRHWCTFCGIHHSQAPRLVTGMYGAVCLSCAEQLLEQSQDAPAPVDKDPLPDKPPCCFCGRRTARISREWSTICHACVVALAPALTD